VYSFLGPYIHEQILIGWPEAKVAWERKDVTARAWRPSIFSLTSNKNPAQKRSIDNLYTSLP
jgi:hypothetical protein